LSERFRGKVVLVTGSTGIAAAAARAMSGEGGRVFVVSRTAQHVDELLHELGPECAGRSADLTQEEDVESAVAEAVQRYGRIDCVYNVAGISARRFGDGPLHELNLEGWQTSLATNVTSQMLVCRAAIRQMLTQDPVEGGQRGAILNMSSVLSRHPSPEFFSTHAYAAGKGAIESLSRSAAAYYAPHGIRVNVIAPALVATPMSARAGGQPSRGFRG